MIQSSINIYFDKYLISINISYNISFIVPRYINAQVAFNNKTINDKNYSLDNPQ